MTKEEQIEEQYSDIPFMFANGFSEAIIGVNVNMESVVYDRDVIIEILIGDGMTREEALEHFYYNIAGAYVGEHTPEYIIGLDG